MITDRIREFVGRDWGAARAAKDAYWRERVDGLGPQEAWRIAEELRQQASAQVPGWPSEEARRADLLDHVRLSGLLRRIDAVRRA